MVNEERKMVKLSFIFLSSFRAGHTFLLASIKW